MSDDYIDTYHTDEVICPYCGYKFSDSWEFNDNCTIECEECEKKFDMSRQTEITYCTSKIISSTRCLKCNALSVADGMCWALGCDYKVAENE